VSGIRLLLAARAVFKCSDKDEASNIETPPAFQITASSFSRIQPQCHSRAMAATLIYQHTSTDVGVQQYRYLSAMSSKKNQDQPAPFRGEFSFVNKDAGNIDSKDHNAAVSWHVMNRYERWKKQEQAKKLRASANVPIGPLSPPSSPNRLGRKAPYEVPKSTRLTQDPQTRPASTVTPITAPLFGFDPWTTDQPLQLGYPGLGSGPASTAGWQSSSTSTPSTQSGGLLEDEPPVSLTSPSDTALDLVAGDLFETPAVPMTPLISKLLTFAYEHLIPESWPNESGRAQGSYEVARRWDDSTVVAQDRCYANAYLSLLAAVMATVTDDDGLTYQSRYFQGQAMSELRQKVARPGSQDLITLKAILKLFSFETVVDNTSVARIHLKMLRNLVTQAGGIILLDSWFREDLLSCDCYFALKYETRPLFPAQEWTPGPLSQPWKARLVSAGIVGDHAATIDPLIEHPVMKAIFTDLRELFKADQYVQNHDVPADDQLLRWRQLRKFDCVSRLADHYVNLIIYPHLFNRPRTETIACIATALMTNMTLGSPEPVRFGSKLLNGLRQKLGESLGEDDGEAEAEGESSESEAGDCRYQRLMLWTLYVGSVAEKVHPAAARVDHEWFGRRFRSQAAKMNVSAWEDTRRVLRQFLYSEKLHQEVETGRAHRQLDMLKGLYTTSGCSWREPIIESNFGPGEEEVGLSESNERQIKYDAARSL